MIENLRNTIVHEIEAAIEEAALDMERTGKPQDYLYRAADRIVAKLKAECIEGEDINKWLIRYS